MAKAKKDIVTTEVSVVANNDVVNKVVTPNDLEWTDHVLGLLSDDEKIAGNPTTDGLRRIFELALDCVITSSDSTVVQSPDVSNEKRATVVHSITYALNNVVDNVFSTGS